MLYLMMVSMMNSTDGELLMSRDSSARVSFESEIVFMKLSKDLHASGVDICVLPRNKYLIPRKFLLFDIVLNKF